MFETTISASVHQCISGVLCAALNGINGPYSVLVRYEYRYGTDVEVRVCMATSTVQVPVRYLYLYRSNNRLCDCVAAFECMDLKILQYNYSTGNTGQYSVRGSFYMCLSWYKYSSFCPL